MSYMVFGSEVNPNCVNADMCDTSAYIRQLNCDTGPSFDAPDTMCTCDGDCAAYNAGAGLSNNDLSDMGAECQTLCTDDAACKFFRWDREGFTKDITCTLMDENQCATE